MREAGAPSTGAVATKLFRYVPNPPEVVMVALPEIPRNAERPTGEKPGGYLGGGFPQRISYLRVLPPGPSASSERVVCDEL
jgi:hypothetical protein